MAADLAAPEWARALLSIQGEDDGIVVPRFGSSDMEAPWARLEEKIDGLGTRLDTLETQVTSLAADVHKQGLLLEASDNSLKLVAERTLGLRQSVDLGFIDLMKRLDERVQPVEAASRYLASQLPPTKRRRK